ncbi:hypothetical protein [Fibrobacter sp. UWEL]|uniref:hypothetical protein n=1 Tax=Fibrobacter sp. UWEL TaxID=1896209 RepID=UPI00091D6DE5|nr:hypothetical protein [Fibrobacter sp. UWEL]SHK50133.1 hypothetical protein SAMN05720468_102263 [Fibrobacter sp. UWEL]
MKFLPFFFFALILAVLSACDLPFGKEDPVVISVGDTKLKDSDIRRMHPNWDTMDDHSKLSFMERWINEETIYQEAAKSGVLDDTLLQAQIEIATRKLVVDYFLQSYLDTMIVTDAEKLAFYKEHPELYLRGKNMISGAIIYFKEWGKANEYYKMNKSKSFVAPPSENWLMKRVERFDSLTVSPDSCLIPSLTEVTLGKISPMKVCNGALKIAVVTSRLDSADVLPYAEVVDDITERTWVEHQKKVMDRLKDQWKNARPIFSKLKVFSEKE